MGRRFQSYLLLLVAAVWLEVAACAQIPRDRVPLTAVAGKPAVVDSAAATLKDQSLKLGSIASLIGQAVVYMRAKIETAPEVSSKVDVELREIESSAKDVASIGASQAELSAQISQAAKDLRSVIAERDAAIAEAKKQSKRADDADVATKAAETKAAEWEARYRDDFRQTLIGWSVFITLAGVAAGALAGWLAVQGNIKGAIGLGVFAAALFGSAGLLVWFADHWRLVAIGSAFVLAGGVVYLIVSRVKLEQFTSTLRAIVPAVDKFDPQGTSIKRDIEENALKAGVFPSVKHQISKVKQSVRLAGAA